MADLNDGQKESVVKLLKFFDDPTQDYFCLTGPAGVGKTYAITQFVRAEMAKARLLDKPMPKVYLSAPTHKAVSVIADLLEEDSLQVEVGTLHSLLGLYLTASSEMKQLADGGKHRLSDYKLIIVDEGSMVGTKLFAYLSDKMAVSLKKPKIVFIGDSYQLDPVKEKQSPIFTFPGHELTEQMRQMDGNPIGGIIAKCRAGVEHKQALEPAVETLNGDGDGVHILTGNDFRQTVLDTFDTDEYRQDTHFCKVLAWTNREVVKWNHLIRGKLIGKNVDQIVEGEHLTLQSSVRDSEDNLLFHTEQEVEVTGLAIDWIEEYHVDHGANKFKVWVVSGMTRDKIFGTFEVLHEDSRVEYDAYCKKLRNDSFRKPFNWGTYWSFVDQFAEVRPPYACTVHKSQGSSFTNCFVVMTDIIRNQKRADKNRLIYVALSRARQNIILNTKRMA